MTVNIHQLTESLVAMAKLAEEDPTLKEEVRAACREQVALFELSFSSKAKKTPRAARLMARLALERNLPENVKLLL